MSEFRYYQRPVLGENCLYFWKSIFLTYASNSNFQTKGLFIDIFRCDSVFIQIGISRTATTISMKFGDMASLETHIIKYLVTKITTSHSNIFIMFMSNVFTETVGQLVFHITILAFIHMLFRPMFCQFCWGFKVGFTTDCKEKAK